jgi:hypothetical protein
MDRRFLLLLSAAVPILILGGCDFGEEGGNEESEDEGNEDEDDE